MSAVAKPAPAEAFVLRHDADGVATLTLNRPAQRNVLSVGMMNALQAELDALATDRDIKVVVIAANGPGIKPAVAAFDIDMSLCCYCNLCTYPCPTDCIYMTPEYEFATDDLSKHLYRFAKPNAKFLTVNPKPPAPPAPKPAPPAAAPPAGAPPAPQAPPAGA